MENRADTMKTSDTNTSYKAIRIFFLIIGIVLISLSLCAIISDYVSQKTFEASKSWPSTTGEVTGARIEEYTYGDSPTTYGSEIIYNYTVSDIRYSCLLRLRLSASENKAEAEQDLRSFPIGTKLKVLYNPEKPKQCATEYDKEYLYYWGSACTIPIGLFFTLLGTPRIWKILLRKISFISRNKGS